MSQSQRCLYHIQNLKAGYLSRSLFHIVYTVLPQVGMGVCVCAGIFSLYTYLWLIQK